MKTFSLGSIVAVLLAFALGFAATSRQTANSKTTTSATPASTPSVAAAALPVLGPAPAWSLKDVHGQTVTSEQFKGKVVVVDFWATWCGPCRQEIPGYADLQRKYGKDGLAIIGVSLDTDEHASETVNSFIQKFGLNYQVVMGDEAVQTAFGGMDAIPTTFLIDRAGQVRDKKVGAEPTQEYEKKVASLLN